MKWFVSALFLPVAASLSMSDFHVPEFAHFGKRVVLKVMKQLKEHSRTRYIDDLAGYL